jgi:hypothetical protein
VPNDGKGKRGRWSLQETAEFRRLFGTRPLPEIARRLNRPLHGVEQRAEQLFPLRTQPVDWTEEHSRRLTLLVGAVDDDHETVARALGVTVGQVEAACTERRAERDHGRPWTSEDDSFLKAYYGSRSAQALGIALSRFDPDIEQRAQLFQLSKDKAFIARRDGACSTVMPRWTEDEIATLRSVYPNVSNLEIARLVRKSIKSVVSKAHHLGLKKSEERLVVMGAENVALRYRSPQCPTGSSSSAPSA